MTGSAQLLSGLRVLIVEDQYLIADEMARSITALGGELIGPCPSVAAARRTITTDAPDIALLDVNLRGENVFALANDLARLQVPFAFATGYDEWMIPAEFSDRPRVEKPLTPAALQQVVAELKRQR